MTNLDNLKSTFSQKLDQTTQQYKTRLDAEFATLRAQYRRPLTAALPADIARRLAGADERLNTQQAAARQGMGTAQPLLNLQDDDTLAELDRAFAHIFDLGRYYPLERLAYPIVYCESLEEFFTPIVESLHLSAQARQATLQAMAAEAAAQAEKYRGGGTFGYNLAGVGCYLNGWLFAYGAEQSPRLAFQTPQRLERILATAVHEKLGHGFLEVYSALGEVKNKLGITMAETARRFGYLAADNPLDSLRHDQAVLLNRASSLVEEGWATWVEAFLPAQVSNAQHAHYPLEAVLAAIANLPADTPNRQELHDDLLGALGLLFMDEPVPPELLLQAVMIVNFEGGSYDDYFQGKLGQPLRYVIGDLLLVQAEGNLGPLCLPYAALIAANITFDPQGISLSDLREMLFSKPNLNPDARLAALSRMRLETPNHVPELARRAEAELSFSVPPELKR